MKPDDYKIYKRPLVQKVIFQIKFAPLFLIENRIGEFQTKILKNFPESELIIRRELLFADVGPKFKREELPFEENIGRKVWKFKSDNNYELDVQINSLSITSIKHKSYYKNDSKEGFRDIIEDTLNHFFSIVPLKLIKRIGLRYIDEAPIPSLETEKFKEWYNTTFPLSRFKLEDVGSMLFQALNVKRNKYEFNYVEAIQPEEDKKTKESKFKYYIDFDGYAGNISTDNYLAVLDDLHDLIHKEWSDNTIRQPVKDWMDKINGDD